MTTFYENCQQVFRFGDVVKGFAQSTPILSKPLLEGNESLYHIEVSASHFSVILSPCCSIDNGMLALAPLKGIQPSFYQNPWLVEDFTRINRKMPADKSVPPHVWKAMPQNVKEEEFDLEKDGYAFDDFFVYAENPFLSKYILNIPKIGQKETGYYMIDFKTIYRINCDKIKRDKEPPIEAKLLQISKESRADLRNKISAYFARIPDGEQI
jgi:hypothetical protein